MTRFLFCAAVLICSSSVYAADWPQFRGPNSSGVAHEKNLPLNWSSNENIRWKIPLPGRGVSNPIVAKGRIYVTASSGWQQDRLHVLCYEEKTGKKIWERQFWGTGASQSHPKTCMAAPTPVTDGKHIYALFATHDLVALDKDGNLLWFRSLTTDYPTVGNNVGMASSPILWKDVLIMAVENAGESFALGIDKMTGQNRWRVQRNRQINWVTPLIVKSEDRDQVILQSPNELSGLDPATGKKLWKFTGQKMATIPSPVYADGLIYAQGGNFVAIHPGSAKKKPEVEWDTRKLRCGFASPLVYDGKLYALTSKGVLRCADAATGAELWDARLAVSDFAASPVAGDGKIYCVSEEGTTYIVDADNGKFLAANPINEKILATPVIANGAIYLRSDDHLFCIGKKQ